MRRFVFFFAAVMNLLLVDQAVKAAAISRLKGNLPVTVLDGFFNLAYVENRGCAWGMFQGHVWPLAVFAVVAMAFVIWKRRSIFPKGAFGVVSEVTLYAGILGNFVDRIWLGYVVDLFDFHWGTHHFPCFNVADVYINIAAGLLILTSFVGRKPESAGDPS